MFPLSASSTRTYRQRTLHIGQAVHNGQLAGLAERISLAFGNRLISSRNISNAGSTKGKAASAASRPTLYGVSASGQTSTTP